eukprot:CAMPEP_0194111544 /NCGR_PEP_ID=MMETSP0150-20130528/10529_1 /TAXON_ID=122233 /ORGANISM="Chaetoceros debilis, Strain MM31A-1" /LENGTH=743 /DNA_ID=CAMNT_0038801019 /DNA_START=42 /DNA_END=2273 /DNA_ORIENTATION=+
MANGTGMTRRKRSTTTKSSKKDREQAPLLPVETHGYKQYKNDGRNEEPFFITNLKVGGALTVLLLFLYIVYVHLISGGGLGVPTTESEGVWNQYVTTDDGTGTGEDGEIFGEEEKVNVFPTFTLKDKSKYDSWGIAELFQDDADSSTSSTSTTFMWDKHKDKKAFLKAASELREEFARDYGGENAAREILAQGLSTFEPKNKSNPTGIPEGIRCTAKRIVDAMQNKNKNKKQKNKSQKPALKISFAGSGAVSGRGNSFDMSFPSILAGMLIEPFETLGIELEVRNAAVADIATFPYGFCLDNFLGSDADVVSFDPEMVSRGDTTSAFEAYIRHAITMTHAPMVLVRETTFSETRRNLIQQYVDEGAMFDPLIFNVEAARILFKELEDSIVPLGFQDWEEFSGPSGSPGKTRVNISQKQHELMGRMLSMHFLAAAELAVAHMMKVKSLPSDILEVGPSAKADFQHYYLPKPQTEIQKDKEKNGASSSESASKSASKSADMSLMFGSKKPGDQKWYMNEVFCRTSFDPVITGTLDEIIVSGTDAEDIDLLRPRGPMLYNKRWVLDMGSSTKKLATGLEQYNLGYQDVKKGYFGVKPSGNLTMFIPYQLNDAISTYDVLENDYSPSDVYTSVVICQVNERADCKIEEDMSFVLGNIPSQPELVHANGVSYFGRKYCITLDVPADASWSKREVQVSELDGRGLRLHPSTEESGLMLTLAVSNELKFWKDGPCSVSHVIWEQSRKVSN